MSNESSVDNQNLSIYESLVVGIFFYYLLAWTESSYSLPLVDFYPRFFLGTVNSILSAVILILALFQKKYFKILMSLAACSLLIVTIFNYSSSYAFRHFTILVFLFAIIFNGQDLKDKKLGSQLLVALLFFFAVFQKMNPEYLAGREYTSGGSFMAFYDLWFPSLVPNQLKGAFQYLPHVSIVIELIIAFGLLVLPKLFTHVAALFLLVLCFINPPVLNVYFLLLPFFILMNEDILKYLNKSSIKHFFSTPYFWAFSIYISTVNIKKFETAITRNFIFVIIIIGIHLYVLSTSDKKEIFRLKLVELGQMRILVIPFIMLALFLGSFVFLPSPFGFKMFSGKRFQIPYYDLRISNVDACVYAKKKWFFSKVTDSALIVENDSCLLMFPSKSGIHYAASHLCENFNEIRFSLKKSDNPSEESLSCLDFRN